MNDTVNHPDHYTSHPSGVECLTITRHMGFNLGNAVKYIWRADLKGSAVEDLRKASFYIADEIKRLDAVGYAAIGGEIAAPIHAPIQQQTLAPGVERWMEGRRAVVGYVNPYRTTDKPLNQD